MAGVYNPGGMKCYGKNRGNCFDYIDIAGCFVLNGWKRDAVDGGKVAL